MTPESELTAEQRRLQAREPLQVPISFIADFDILDAAGVDLSEGGICFETDAPLTFHLRFEHEGQTVDRHARLAWVSRTDGGNRLGLRFVDVDDTGTF